VRLLIEFKLLRRYNVRPFPDASRSARPGLGWDDRSVANELAGNASMPKPVPAGANGALPLVMAVYGTLRTGERNHYLLRDAQPLGTAWVTGDLYRVPTAPFRPYAYPALVVPGAGRVAVELYRLTDQAVLNALDQLELYLPASEADSQYLRRMVPVHDHRPAPGTEPVSTAATYVYNGPDADLGELIASGEWVADDEPAQLRLEP
jgi:gamma-glutamylcyclotransferase (GGCT)/AIG2-like uncharacterized protein YtfP